MALSYAVRRQLLAASLPESTEVRLELQDYLARTGMTPPDFARRIRKGQHVVYQMRQSRVYLESDSVCDAEVDRDRRRIRAPPVRR